MHKVLPKNILYKLSVSSLEQEYLQRITAKTLMFGNTETQETSKTVIFKSMPHESDKYLFRFLTKNTKLKLEPKYNKQEYLTKKIAQIIDVLELEISNTNTPLSIKNHKYLINKWHQLKTELSAMYKGENAENYFFGLDKRVNNQESLLKNILQLKTFGMFFMLPFSLYHLNYKYSNTRSIDNMVEKLPLLFNETFTLIESSNKQATFSINGKLSDNQKYPLKIKNHFSRLNISKENKLSLKEYKGYLTLNTVNGLLEEFQLNITIKCGEYFLKTIEYQTVNTQLL